MNHAVELNLKNLGTTFDSKATFLFMLTFATCAFPWLILTFIDFYLILL